jgi:hypothetical protein
MLGGFPVIYGIDPHSSESSPSHTLGTIGISPDGRQFRYVKNNASNAMVAGTLQQAPVEDTGDQNLTPAANAAIGATSVSLATATVTANQYADGYLVITSTPGEGLYYRIKGHAAATAATVVINLHDPLKIAVTTGSKADLVANPYNGVLINPTTQTSAPVGLALTSCPASYYTWIQTKGPGVVLAQGTLTVGYQCVASNGTPGAVESGVDATDAQALVGVSLTGCATTENGAVLLNLP